MSRKELTFAEMSQLIRADFESGLLYWIARKPHHFRDGVQSAQHICNKWNTVYAGKEALSNDVAGYKAGQLLGTTYRAHRVIWLLHYGEWPTNNIDHINGVRSDNRISNLRDVTKSQNSKNSKMYRHNTSGVMGVYLRKGYDDYIARIQVDGNFKHLGVFKDFDSAVAARKAAEQMYGFHQNHGRQP